VIVERAQRRPAVAGEIGRSAASVPPRAVDRHDLGASTDRRQYSIPIACAAGLAVQQQ
jgi:hypothetical protein